MQPFGPDPTPVEGAQYEYAFAEQSITWTPRPDGSLVATHRYLIDAEEGKPAHQAVSGYVAPIRLKVSEGYASSWSTTPTVHDVKATDRTGSGAVSPLTVTVGPAERGECTTRITVRHPEGWSKGRHLIALTHRWEGVWVGVDGTQLMVLPHLRLDAPWYGINDDSETMRLRLTDRATIFCRGDHPDYPENRATKDAACPTRPTARSSPRGRFNGLGMVSANTNYYYVRTPAGVTAPPIPVKEEPK